METPSPCSGSAGRWIVAVLLLLGLAGAMASVVYWRRQTEPAPPANAPLSAEVRARRELEDLESRAKSAITDGNVDPVIPLLRAYIQKYAGSPGGHRLLGQLLMEQQDKPLQESFDELELSLKYDPRQPEVERMAGVVAQALSHHAEDAGDHAGSLELMKKALHHLGMAVSLDQGNATYRVFLAQCYIQAGDRDMARVTALEALRMDSHQHMGYYVLGTLDASDGKTKQAIKQIRRALEEVHDDPRDASAYTQFLARLLLRDNQPEEALHALEGLGIKERLTVPVLSDMADCWMMMGQPAKGAELFVKAMNGRPVEWRFPAKAAEWYLKAGDKAAAAQMIDEARRLNADGGVIKDLERELAKPAATAPASAPNP